MTAEEADLWGDFIADAVALVDDGYTLLRTPSEWGSFLSGCAGDHPTEPDLTSGLGDRIRRLWIDAPLDSSRNDLHFSYEAPTPGDQAHGKHKTKADFRIERKFDAGYCASFVLEAKGLKTPADLTGKYLGKDGIGCFLERSPPYTEDILGGMVGYAYGKHATWLPALAKAITSGTALRQDVVAVVADRMALASDHQRTSLGNPLPITVLHTVLDFETT